MKNIAVVGGTGDLGSYVVRSLAGSSDFTVTVLTRGSKKSDIGGVKYAVVDYDDVSALTAVLHGQDAVVSVVPGQYSELQIKIIEAAIAAKVSLFIPSEFGSDNTNSNTRKLPLMKAKVAVDEYLKESAAAGKISYSRIVGGPFVEWMFTDERMMPIKERKFFIHDGGDVRFSMTRMGDYGEAIVGVLKNAEATKNRTVYVESFKATQNHLLSLAKEVLGGEWQVEHADTEANYAVAEKRLFAGEFDMSVISPLVFKTVFTPGYGGDIDPIDNDLVGIKRMTDDDLMAVIKSLA
ncbi:hypothetical protein BKA56DRAFT_637645 [Ilyonectria sp. MPI-CAGE-AT-0026]|nr:hypothetical protein BKA56DRAFT_637645 [Ilyonectria sp. MPI-CAGE-AT-0026]